MATLAGGIGTRARIAVTVLTVGLVAAPAAFDVGSFPLSEYPIYADRRPRAATLSTVVGVDESGTAHRLSLATIASTDDPLIAQSTVANAIEAGDADALCADVARRAGARFVAVEVVTERHDIVRYASGDDDSLLDRSVLARCDGRAR